LSTLNRQPHKPLLFGYLGELGGWGLGAGESRKMKKTCTWQYSQKRPGAHRRKDGGAPGLPVSGPLPA